MMLNIEDLRMLCTDDTIFLTQHLQQRMHKHGVRYDDLTSAMANGEIIEQYPNDYPYPSCLVLGFAENGDALHVVCGIGNGILWIITVYYPSADKWESDNKTRKGKSES